MQFQLPQNLKQALVAYDPQLKKLAQEQQAKAKPKKNSNSLGIFDLKIPHDVISPSSLETVMKEINTKPTNKRYYRYEDTEKNYSLIIFNVRSIWYAAWTPPKGSDYLYGYAFAFNANESTSKRLTVPQLSEEAPSFQTSATVKNISSSPLNTTVGLLQILKGHST